MPPRYTIRQVVGTYRRKAFGTRNDDGSARRPAYEPDAIVAFYGMLELAEEQPRRGHFESERLLRVLLEGPTGKGRRFARQVPFLIKQGDLVAATGGGLDVEGWEILQEGDTTIADRVHRFRARKRNAPDNANANGASNDAVTADVTPDVTDGPRTGDVRAPRRARNAVATATRLPGYEARDARPPTWFDAEAAEGPALVWLAEHGAALEPNGNGLHRKLCGVVEGHGSPAVIKALEQALLAGARTTRQFVFALDDLLDPPLSMPREKAPDPEEQASRRRAERERTALTIERARRAAMLAADAMGLGADELRDGTEANR